MTPHELFVTCRAVLQAYAPGARGVEEVAHALRCSCPEVFGLDPMTGRARGWVLDRPDLYAEASPRTELGQANSSACWVVLFAEVVALRGHEADHVELMALAMTLLTAGQVSLTRGR